MIFQILTAASMKITAFWNVAPCSLAEVTDVLEVLAASIILHRPDDGGSKHL
jgi:hypothetical protein